MSYLLKTIGFICCFAFSFYAFSQTSTPTAYAASSITSTSFKASWSNHNLYTYRTKYTLEIATNSSFSNIIALHTLVGITSYDITGLSSGQTYYFRVKAQYIYEDTGYASDEASDWSNTISLTTLSPPSTPNRPVLVSMDGSAFTVSWGSVSNAIDYEVRISSQGLDTYSYQTSDLSYTYLFRHPSSEVETIPSSVFDVSVKAINDNGESDYSSTLSITTTPPPPYMDEPKNITTSSFDISWSSPFGGSSYEVDVSEDSDFSTMVSGYNSKSVTGTSLTVTGLESSTLYYVRVRGVNSSGSSLDSDTQSVRTLLGTPNSPVLVSMDGSAFTVSWGSVSNAIDYEVRISSQGLDTYSYETSDLSYTYLFRHPSSEVETIPSRIYGISVKAINDNGESDYSPSLSITTTPPPPYMDEPKNITTSSFDISWSSPFGGSSYEVDVSEDSDFSTMVSGYNSKSVTGTSLTVTGLESSTLYYVRVRGVNSSGSSLDSDTQSVRTLLGTPNSPVLVSMDGSAFTVSWGSVSNAIDYEVRISSQGLDTYSYETSDLSYTYLFRHPSSEVETIPSRIYGISVKAINDNGESDYSPSLSITTTPPPPYMDEPKNITTSSFDISWSSPFGGSSYEVDVSEDSDFSTMVSGYNSKSVTGTSLTVTGLESSTLYYVRVRGVNSSGSSLDSDTQSVRTLLGTPNSPVLVSMDGSAFTVSWGSVSNAIDYEVRISSQGLDTYSYETSDLSYTYLFRHPSSEVETIPSRIYGVSVKAINDNGESDYSPSLSITTTPPPPYMDEPKNITTSSFDISWSSPFGGSSYEVDVSEDSDFSIMVSGYNSKSVTGTSLTVTGLESLTEYYARVRGVNSSGSSLNSDTRSVVLRSEGLDPITELSLDQNFVRVEVPKVPVSSEYALTVLGPDHIATSFDYFDGLGRATQSVAVAVGPNTEDQVQFYAYNETTGRQDHDYMPYYKETDTPGTFTAMATAENEQQSFYEDLHDDSRPYTFTNYDERGRVETVTGVGDDWASVSTTYETHLFDPDLEKDGDIDYWEIDNDLPVHNSHYKAKELYISVVTDVEEKKARTVTDGRGLTITQQVYADGRWIGSFNVYDDFGRLRFVIPPLITSTIAEEQELTEDEIREFLFQYEYDEKGRLKREKAPGASWNEYVYDRWDRLVLSRYEGQTYNGTANAWNFTKYDALNRVVMTGIVYTSQSRDEIQAAYNTNTAASRYETFDAGTEHGYTTTNSVPTSFYELLTISYYDQYDFITSGWDEENNDYAYAAPAGLTEAKTDAVIGQVTGSKTRVIGTDKWLNTVVYYDDKLRVIQAVSENHLGGVDRTSSELDWKGELQKTLVQHEGHEEVDILTEFEYARNGDLLETWQTITEPGNSKTGDRILTAAYEYNVLGQVVEKNLHSTNGSTFLQSVDYDYNIKGWTSAINDANLSDGEGDLFGMQFNYTNSLTISDEDNVNVTLPGRYDGMVSSVEWNVDNAALEGGSGGTFGKTAVGYQYDDRNRLAGTQYATAVSGAYTGDAGAFNMTVPEYDDNGNIRQLTRKSEGATIDNLTYTYESSNQSNKLTQVTDAGTTAGFNNQSDGTTVDYAGEFDYNDQGQMTSDANKQIVDIRYNHLQLVDYIEFFDYTRIHYTYDAVGNRLSKEVKDADGNSIGKVDYLGLVEYYNEEINQVFTDEGRAYKQNDAYHYEYFITDHQGNNRVAFGNLPERHVYTATMETRHAATEESEFAFPDNIRSTAENHTPLGDYSVALNGTDPNRILGPAKVLNISAGDEVDLEVWAKYIFDDWDNSTIPDVATAIATAFGGASAGTGLEGASGSLTNALNGGGAWLFDGNESGEPEAYLQYLFFKTDYSFPDDGSGSGYVPVGADALDGFTKLASPTLTFDEPGYLFVYVVNESNQNAEVFFDDLKITHASGETDFRVTQVNDYYPFGLPTSNSWRAPGYIDPGLLYQSSYAHYDSLTGYYDFLSRSYDPALGRFFAVDPAGQFSSPYVGMGNLPHAMVDPNGEWAGLVIGSILAAAGQAGVQSLNGNGSFGENLVNNGFVVGGGYSQNQSYVGTGTASLGMVSTYNFPNQGSPIFGGFAPPGNSSGYSLPGPFHDSGLTAALAPSPSNGIDYNFMLALKRRNTFYSTIPLGGSGSGGHFYDVICSTCDPNEYDQSYSGGNIGDWMKGGMLAINTVVGALSTHTVFSGKFYKWNNLWHRTKTAGTAWRWQSRWNKGVAPAHRAKQIETVAGARKLASKLTKIGGVLVATDIVLSGELKPSHAINAALLAGSTTGIGAIFAGAYFLADFGTMGFNYFLNGEAIGIGDMIDQSLGTIEMYDGLY